MTTTKFQTKATNRARCERCNVVTTWINTGDGQFRCGACGKTARVAEPTDLGREGGYHLARLTDEASYYRDHPDAPPMCVDCAFRSGSDPNGSPETVLMAFQCAVSGEPFDCHHGLDEVGNPTRPCAGWLIWQERKAAATAGGGCNA